MECFQRFKVARLKAERDKTALPAFEPPKPTVQQGMLTLFECCDSTFTTDKFKLSMKTCFEDVCLAPIAQTETESTFQKYREHKHGSLNPNLWKYIAADRETGSLGETVEDISMQTRNDAMDDMNAEDQESDSSDSDASDVE